MYKINIREALCRNLIYDIKKYIISEHLNVFQRSNPIPLQLQWVEAKREHPTSLIFMKVHRFYEVFHKDADVVVVKIPI